MGGRAWMRQRAAASSTDGRRAELSRVGVEQTWTQFRVASSAACAERDVARCSPLSLVCCGLVWSGLFTRGWTRRAAGHSGDVHSTVQYRKMALEMAAKRGGGRRQAAGSRWFRSSMICKSCCLAGRETLSRRRGESIQRKQPADYEHK